MTLKGARRQDTPTYRASVLRHNVCVLVTEWPQTEWSATVDRNFDVLLTVHLSIILATDQLNAQNLLLQ